MSYQTMPNAIGTVAFLEMNGPAATIVQRRCSLRRYIQVVIVVLILCIHVSLAFQLPGTNPSRRYRVPVPPCDGCMTKANMQSPVISSKFVSTSSNGLLQSVAVANDNPTTNSAAGLSPPVAALVKAGMLAFIAGMCLALPATLYPQKLLYRLGLINRQRKEQWALATGEFCARWMLRLIPFCTVETIYKGKHDMNPQPAIWVCNHTSMLDVFILLATDRKLRGPKKRPIKIVYWKDLEANPITALLFRQAGFFSVAMTANKPGEDNEYDKGSFKLLLKDVKRAFDEDFDVALLPEGQLNPTPELGLQPVFGGAYTLAKMSRRPIHIMALYGIHKLWHPNPEIGMTVTDRRVKVRVYPHGRTYSSADEFKETFETVVGQFGATGIDLPDNELESWLTGETWKQKTNLRSES